MDAEVFFGLQVAVHGAEALPRVPRAAKERADFLEILTDAEFKRHFRFSKNTVVDIVSMLEPDLVQDPRGDPLTPVQQVCAALCHYGGGHYQRITGLGSRVSQYAGRAAMIRVTDALISRKAQFISMPDIQEMQETSQKMLYRFGLPRFAMAVDGMMARFEEAPRKLPAGKHQNNTGVGSNSLQLIVRYLRMRRGFWIWIYPGQEVLMIAEFGTEVRRRYILSLKGGFL